MYLILLKVRDFYASIDGKIYIGTKTIDVLKKFKKYKLNDYELINYISLDFNKISSLQQFLKIFLDYHQVIF